MRGGDRIKISSPSDALAHGIVLIPEDRKVHGLHLDLPVRWNLAMATLEKRSRLGVIRMRAEREFALTAIAQAAIRVKSPFDLASTLSGGTQQKVVLRKFLECDPSILLFVDAMRGIDVQTKFGFYRTLRELTGAGNSCILYSSDTEELVGLCDRIAVFHDGVPVRILEGADITQDGVVAASFAVGADSK
jgi:ribose transport system ATP-binding protein